MAEELTEEKKEKLERKLGRIIQGYENFRVLLDNSQTIAERIFNRGKCIAALIKINDICRKLSINTTEVGEARIDCSEGAIKTEINNQQEDIKLRIGTNKEHAHNLYREDNNPNHEQRARYSLGQELADKVKRIHLGAQEVKTSQSAGEKVVGALKTAGYTLSTAGTVLKAPIHGVLRTINLVSGVVATVVVSPLHVPMYLFSALFRGDFKKYDGSVVRTMGNGLSTILSGLTDVIDRGIMGL